MNHYANAGRAEPGRCWRMVSRDDGYRKGSPTDCPEFGGEVARLSPGDGYDVSECHWHVPSLGCPHWVSGIAFPRPNTGRWRRVGTGFLTPRNGRPFGPCGPTCKEKWRVEPVDTRSL